MPITRREMLGLLSSSTFFLTAAPVPLAADDTTPDAPSASPSSLPTTLSAAGFEQGVASADPQPDAIMLWTRAVPETDTDTAVNLLLELAQDEAFTQKVLSTPVACTAEADYTVRAYVNGLQADSRYYYRFRAANNTFSRIGRTRTAPPADSARTANVAFTSCQSYEQAHFGGWARMIAEDRAAAVEEQIDFVLHLGDFIYERSWHTRVDGSPQARRVPDLPDGVDTDENRYAVSLADYRHLYKVYLSDPHLQEARARWPFVCTWDDHEYANDNYQSYSTYHGEHRLDPARKLRANQAWFEFMPAVLDELQGQPARGFQAGALGAGDEQDNRTAIDSLCIYRRLRWGSLVDVVLTDTRSYRSPPCLAEGFAETLDLPLNTVKLVEICDAGQDYDGGKPPPTLPYGDGTTPNPAQRRPAGTLLGAEQREWLLDTLGESRATWKLWGNSLPLLPMRLDMSTLPFTDYEDSLINLDAWGGYPSEQAYLMDAISERRIGGVVSLSGDHHMHGAGIVNRSASQPDAPAVTVDFTVAGLSSSPVFGDLVAAARESHGGFSSLVFTETEPGAPLEPVWHMSMLDGVLAASIYARSGLRAAARWLGPNSANTGLMYTDTTVNGYGLARFSSEQLTVQMVALEDCREDFTTPPQIRYTARFDLPLWDGGTVPQLAGPHFDGQAPFPFS